MFAFWRVAVRVNDQVVVAVVRGLERHTGVDADEPTGGHVNPLWRLAHVQRERAGEDDKRLLLGLVPVPPPPGAGLVTPDVRARVREAGDLTQLCDVARRLTRLVWTRDPLELGRDDDLRQDFAGSGGGGCIVAPGSGNGRVRGWRSRFGSSAGDGVSSGAGSSGNTAASSSPASRRTN